MTRGLLGDSVPENVGLARWRIISPTMEQDLIDVTSLHRPDTSWVTIDAHGHEHRWYVAGKPAASYSPSAKHETPTLVWVKDGEEYWDGDDEPHDVGHLECRQCGERINPGFTADTHRQFVPGLRSIDGPY